MDEDKIVAGRWRRGSTMAEVTAEEKKQLTDGGLKRGTRGDLGPTLSWPVARTFTKDYHSISSIDIAAAR